MVKGEKKSTKDTEDMKYTFQTYMEHFKHYHMLSQKASLNKLQN